MHSPPTAPVPSAAGLGVRASQGVQQGSHNVQHNYFGATPLAWPVRFGSIPVPADSFQARDIATPDEHSPSAVVLTGLGGTGKTQVAAAIARAAAPTTDLLMWVTAAGRTSVVEAYALAARRIGLVPDSTSAEPAAGALLAWLADSDRSWMVVLDDLSDPADVRGLWPQGPCGRIVVTTRRTDSVLRSRGRRRIDIGAFTAAEARDFLMARLGDQEDEAQSRALAEDLSHLPLALAQAASFITDRGETCAGYRRRLADRRRTLDEVFPADAAADDYSGTVAVTWSISVEAADRIEPLGLSRPLLHLLGVTDPNGCPLGLLTTPAVRTYLANSVGRDALRHDDDVRDALHNLARMSLISVEPGDGPRSVRVHALVQRAARDELDPQHRGAVLRVAADALVQAWPDIDRDRELGLALRANAASVIDHDHGHTLWMHDSLHMMLWRNGRSIGESGAVVAAVDYWEQLHRTAADIGGADHPATISARFNVAMWTGETGHVARAAVLMELVLQDQIRVLGRRHPDVVDTRNALAMLHGKAGNPARAVTAIAELLAEQTCELAHDSIEVLKTRHNLAGWTGEAGDANSALIAAQDLVADCHRVLGPDDPLTLDVRYGIATWQAATGDAAEAISCFRAVRDDQMRILGPDNPKTLVTRADIAWWLGSSGDLRAAIADMTALIGDCQQILGPDHHITLVFRHRHVRWLGEAGDPAAAALAADQLATDRRRVLGSDHPDTLDARATAGDWLGEAGDPAGAVTALTEVVNDHIRILGRDHPTTLASHAQLAWWQGNGGRPDDALATLHRLLPDVERVHGSDHPMTLGVRHSIIRWLGDSGDVDAALDGVGVIDPEDPDVNVRPAAGGS